MTVHFGLFMDCGMVRFEEEIMTFYFTECVAADDLIPTSDGKFCIPKGSPIEYAELNIKDMTLIVEVNGILDCKNFNYKYVCGLKFHPTSCEVEVSKLSVEKYKITVKG